MKAKLLKIADLFCGAGGTSTGAVEAAELLGYVPRLVAINHWDKAIATHTANHPRATHLLTEIDNVNPRDLYKPGELDLLWASPECMHHSVARGGRPINEQRRATAWCVVRWADAIHPAAILVENVPEFISWGGIGSNGRPLKNKRGKTFMAWITALESLGYRVDWRVLCAADYGDPTTRRRLFIQAVRGRRKIIWPEPTHTRTPRADMFTLQKPWVAAREIIDWDLQGHSAAKGAQSLKEPLDTVTAKDRHALVRPIVVIRGQKYLLDIRFRMLQPHELAGAQGFPRDYKFEGTKTEQVKLIGNAVPRRLARALVYAVLSQRSDCDQLLNEA